LSSFSQSNDSIDISDTSVYTVVEKNPEFPGGDIKLFEYLRIDFNFKDCNPKKGFSGRIYIHFIVEKDGSVSNVMVKNGHGCVDNEAIKRIKNMPKWKPGLQRGIKVRVKFNLPIHIRLR